MLDGTPLGRIEMSEKVSVGHLGGEREFSYHLSQVAPYETPTIEIVANGAKSAYADFVSSGVVLTTLIVGSNLGSLFNQFEHDRKVICRHWIDFL